MSNLSVIIHGGAGSPSVIPEQPRELPFLKQAVDAAWKSLVAGEPGERAVVAALRVLEACEYFNAGFGSYPNSDGEVRLDAALMRGNGDFISLMNLRRVVHPSELALHKLTPGKDVMLAWTDGLMQLLDQADTDLKRRVGWVAEEKDMLAPWALARVAERKAKLAQKANDHDTIGCVVRDIQGKICAGTSTGGLMLKPHGRIGDSPIVGAGVFADDEVCGLSATGTGEVILKSLLSGFVVADIRSFLRADPARFEKEPELLKKILTSELSEMRRKYPAGEAGLIVVPQRGNPAYDFNSKVMSVGVRCGTAEKIEFEDIRLAH